MSKNPGQDPGLGFPDLDHLNPSTAWLFPDFGLENVDKV